MPNIKCGHCDGYHGSVDAVLVCASNHGYRWAKRQPAQPERHLRPVKPTEERRDERRGNLVADIRAAGRAIPEGRYALRNQGGPNDVSFYHVTKSTSGAVFVKRFSSDETFPINMKQTLDVLTRIGRDIQGAMELFGLKSSRCGHCGRRLTTKESRERGIGPVCANNMGFVA